MAEARTDPDLETLEQFVSLAEEMARARGRRELNAFQIVALGFLIRSWRDARGVILLCREGLTEQALVLARTIWEAAVAVEYIRRDPDTRARLYIGYDPVLRWNMLQKAIKHPNLAGSAALLQASQDRPEQFAELESLYNSVKGNYPKPKEWAGMTLRGMAEELNILSDYLFVYSWVSEQAHVEVTAIGHQFALQDPNTVRIEFPDYRMAATTIAGWIGMILGAFNEAFDLSFAPRIEAIMEAGMKQLGQDGGAE